MKFEIVTLPVRALEVCARSRVRKHAPTPGSDIIIEYAEAYRAGLILEPLDVFREKGTERYIVADGEHRLLALNREKIAKVECRLHEGDEIDALEFATRCNQAHGLRRTKEDIYHAFVRIQETPRLKKKYATDAELGRQLGISQATVTRYKIQWRDSEGGSEKVRAKKEQARESAAKHTPERKSNSSLRSSDSSGKLVSNEAGGSQKAADAHPPQTASDRAWSGLEEQAYERLCRAWREASERVRSAFLKEHA